MPRAKKTMAVNVVALMLICITAPRLTFAAPGLREQSDSPANETAASKPDLHHILIEVHDIKASLRFYRDCLGLSLTSQTDDFVTLESSSAGVYLWQKRWNWEKPLAKGERSGVGIYPHFAVKDVGSALEKFKKAGFVIVQAAKAYDWGSEAFVRDPDGYVIAIVTMPVRAK
jgi:catechol 2,3-dioxygenase-like lactoylglutathione lyase family enzyme